MPRGQPPPNRRRLKSILALQYSWPDKVRNIRKMSRSALYLSLPSLNVKTRLARTPAQRYRHRGRGIKTPKAVKAPNESAGASTSRSLTDHGCDITSQLHKFWMNNPRLHFAS